MYIAKRPKFLKVSILVMRLPQGTKTLNRGGYRIFQKGGLRPAIRNAGGGGGGGCCPALQARYKMRGRGGGGCLVEEGALPYMKGGGCNPQTPPPPRLDPPLLKKGSAFENRYALCCYEPEMTLKTRPAYKR